MIRQTNIIEQLSEDQRVRGCYLLGSTGQGKSSLLANGIIHDIRQGRGVCVLVLQHHLKQDTRYKTAWEANCRSRSANV